MVEVVVPLLVVVGPSLQCLVEVAVPSKKLVAPSLNHYEVITVTPGWNAMTVVSSKILIKHLSVFVVVEALGDTLVTGIPCEEIVIIYQHKKDVCVVLHK